MAAYDDKQHLLYKIAEACYEDGLTQREIDLRLS